MVAILNIITASLGCFKYNNFSLVYIKRSRLTNNFFCSDFEWSGPWTEHAQPSQIRTRSDFQPRLYAKMPKRELKFKTLVHSTFLLMLHSQLIHCTAPVCGHKKVAYHGLTVFTLFTSKATLNKTSTLGDDKQLLIRDYLILDQLIKQFTCYCIGSWFKDWSFFLLSFSWQWLSKIEESSRNLSQHSVN